MGCERLVAFEKARIGEVKEPEWVEIPDGARAIPDFPTNALPDNSGLLVRSVAASYQAPEGMAAAFAIGVASAAIVGRVEVQPKANEPFYKEAAQTYILVEGASGERKTPVLNVLKHPLEICLDERREQIRAENSGTLWKIKALEREADKERDPDKAVQIGAEIEQLRKSVKPEPEYLMADMTMEAVAQCMEDHEGRAAVINDEAEFLSASTGKIYQRQGAAVNLQPVLSGYNNSSLHGKRITRGEWHIPRASLAICLGCQPKLLRGFMEDAAGADRGLHARFLYFLPESKIGSRSCNGVPLPSSVMAWWSNTIKRLAALARDGEPLVMTFDCYAEAAYKAFWTRIEKRLAGDMGGAIQSWGSKLAGNTVRLAAILALLEGEETVTRKYWDSAETIAEGYLIPCAVGLFLDDDPYISEDARKVRDKIRNLNRFKASELYRDKIRHIHMTNDSFMTALDNLARQGYIRKAAQQPAYCGRGQQPSPIYEVNPQLHKKAIREEEESQL